MTTCLLILLGFCHPTKAQFVLGAVASSAAMTDAWVTQRNQKQPFHYEANPLARPFVEHGAPLHYAAASGEVFLGAWIGNRFKHSKNSVLRKIWWLPQIGTTLGHAYGTSYGVQHYRPNVITVTLGGGPINGGVQR